MYLLHQAFTVPLNRFSPDERVLVGLGFNLCPVDVFHVQADEAFGREKKYGLRKHLVDFFFTRLRKRLMVMKSGFSYPASQI